MIDSSLTEPRVRAIAARELRRAQSMFPEWKHPFTELRFNHAKRSFGHAHRDGRVIISRSFLGTDALADLEDTLRHEFAHLIVGVQLKHGEAWKRVAAALGAKTRATGSAADPALSERMTQAPFTLVAILQSGRESVVRQVFRRSRRYLDYELGKSGRRYRVEGEWIMRFHYIDHRGD